MCDSSVVFITHSLVLQTKLCDSGIWSNKDFNLLVSDCPDIHELPDCLHRPTSCQQCPRNYSRMEHIQHYGWSAIPFKRVVPAKLFTASNELGFIILFALWYLCCHHLCFGHHPLPTQCEVWSSFARNSIVRRLRLSFIAACFAILRLKRHRIVLRQETLHPDDILFRLCCSWTRLQTFKTALQPKSSGIYTCMYVVFPRTSWTLV